MRDIEKDAELCEKALKLPHYRITSDDWEFIAAARTALPWYIGEVKRLREENAALEKCAEYRRKEAEHNQEAGCRYMYENDKLRAENQRLKEALEKLLNEGDIGIHCFDNGDGAYIGNAVHPESEAALEAKKALGATANG